MISLSARLLLFAAAGLTLLFFAQSSATGQAKEDAKVTEGRPAPDVELPATQIDKVLPDKKDAKTLRLKDLQGKKHMVLYFFPKAATKG